MLSVLQADRDPTALPALTGLALGLLAWALYLPGTSGAFLFDDWSNLSLLGALGGVHSTETFWLYLLSGIAGPTGRPLAAASFLLDANTWPADPAAFKRTNILIHLLNAALLTWVSLLCARALGQRQARAAWIAVITAGLWLLHPLWVSSTLYVVQRMAVLSATFVFAGIGLYLWARLRWEPCVTGRQVAAMTAAVAGFGAMATLSKENGALLPLLLIVLEVTVLARSDQSRGLVPSRAFSVFRGMLLGIPALLVLTYLATNVPELVAGERGVRDFTPWERLLTQGRVLWAYVGHLLWPTPYPGGLFPDEVSVSTGLFQPMSTGLAWLAVLALVGLAWRWRRQRPALALGVLFFFTAHLLESTFLQLELYFEHRNYLPGALVFFPLVLWWAQWRSTRSRLTVLVPMVALLVLAGMTGLRADLWGRPFQQALRWAEVNPESPRALHHLASLWLNTGNVDASVRLTKQALALDPQHVPSRVLALSAQCQTGADVSAELRAATEAVAAHSPASAVTRYQVERMLDYLASGRCPQVPLDRTAALITELSRLHPEAPAAWHRMLRSHAGRVSLAKGEPERAFDYFTRALAVGPPNPEAVLSSAGQLASAGAGEFALRLLRDARWAPEPGGRVSIATLRAWYLARTDYFDRERTALERAIRQDLALVNAESAQEALNYAER